MPLLAIVAVALALPTSSDWQLLWLIPMSCVMPALVLGGLPWLVRWNVRNAIRNDPSAQHETTLIFSPNGISSRNAVAQADLTWDAIVQVLETKSDFIFFCSKQSAVVLPKATIPAPEQCRRLRSLVRACAGNRARLLRQTSRS
ncbi:MAG TPA: YcxB family protein, partial [Gemmataceae bacterium]|jgi:hypothetical protein|nr:YcxB family protein [Gemmataceae bacterium]